MRIFYFYKCKTCCKSYTITCMNGYEKYKKKIFYAEECVYIYKHFCDMLFKTLEATFMD